MGQAERDRRVRARPGSKSRQQGRQEQELDEVEGPYTHPRQVSPARKRGLLDSRLSLDAVLSSEPKKILQLCVDAGFLPAEPSEPCKCETPSWLVEERDLQANWRCKKCRKSVSARKGTFLEAKLPLRSVVGAFWLYVSALHLSPDFVQLLRPWLAKTENGCRPENAKTFERQDC